jgi:hypothetical protein
MTFQTTNRNAGTELRALSRVLQDVHRSLIDFSRERYELAKGDVVTRSELLGLVLGHEAFVWLRPLTKLIANIDDLAARADATPAEIAEIGDRAAALMASSDDPNAFGSRYVGLLASEPRIAMHHGDLRAALAVLLEPRADAGR